MIITQLVTKFLNFLYGPLAGFYDLVAFSVSFGRWTNWIFSIEPFVKGKSVLELGFGPGHLLDLLSKNGISVYGIDASWQMSRLARRKLSWKSEVNQTILCGNAQAIPFQSSCMDTIIATFPSNYIFNPAAQNEIRRVLRADGTLLILLAAFPRSDSFPGRLLTILYRLTGETPSNRTDVEDRILARLKQANLPGIIHWIHEKYADLLLIIVN